MRSAETSLTLGASSIIWRCVSSSGARSSCETRRSPRTRRSGSSANECGDTVRSTRFVEVLLPAERIDELAAVDAGARSRSR